MTKLEYKDGRGKHSLFTTLLLLLLSLSFICQAKALTRPFVVELEQNADFPNQTFSIKPDQHTLSGNPLGIVGTGYYSEPGLRSDNKRRRPVSYGMKTTLIESISWQWLYTTNLLVAYELILTTKEPPLSCLWVPVEVVIAVGWLLKSYWNPDSPMFEPIERQGASQSEPLMITTMMPGPGQHTPHYQSSELSDQQAPKAITQRTGAFNSPQHSGSGNGKGNEDPQPNRHTLGLNCFVYPCHGICRLRPSSDNAYPPIAEASYTDSAQPLNHYVSMHGHLPDNNDDLVIISGLLNLGSHGLVEKTGIAFALSQFKLSAGSSQWDQGSIHPSLAATIQAPTAHDKVIFTASNQNTSQTDTPEWAGASPSGCRPFRGTAHCRQVRSTKRRENHTVRRTCLERVLGTDGQQRPCGMVYKNAQALAGHKRRNHTGRQICDLIVEGEDGQLRPCGTVCKNVQTLLGHKKRNHSGQQICDVIVMGEGDLKQPCGTPWRSTKALSDHKRRDHTGQQTCGVTVPGEDGRQRPCGKVCKNAQSLSAHKSQYHTGQQICDFILVGEDGQQQPCGRVCKHSRGLTDHKKRGHSRQQTCEFKVVGKDGQLRPCGVVCKNAAVMSTHKSSIHSGQKICDLTVFGEDGQQSLCGKICRNAASLWSHKSTRHSGQKTCNLTVVTEDGQQRRCAKICKNAKALSKHKRLHQKRKSVDVDQSDSLNP
ncbi:hypothetical protein [Endozoicomonas sp. 8E]|uniref:hypothetical protein n=1 Tax=Endozoicomonas sp. 8E TaxID=3035692 RepID=UPI0029391F57|nr:hypothetical protein [Endozoicomonas sp. 8E]WOG26959.1 hypothetical protein P6910_20775 [Endozoicomonas sp. 8E]